LLDEWALSIQWIRLIKYPAAIEKVAFQGHHNGGGSDEGRKKTSLQGSKRRPKVNDVKDEERCNEKERENRKGYGDRAADEAAGVADSSFRTP
jgi:hypothetical protein